MRGPSWLRGQDRVTKLALPHSHPAANTHSSDNTQCAACTHSQRLHSLPERVTAVCSKAASMLRAWRLPNGFRKADSRSCGMDMGWQGGSVQQQAAVSRGWCTTRMASAARSGHLCRALSTSQAHILQICFCFCVFRSCSSMFQHAPTCSAARPGPLAP